MLRLWRGGSGGAGTLSAIGAARVRLAVGRRLFAEQAPRALTTADITEQQSRKAAIEDAVRRSANKAHAFIIASGIACFFLMRKYVGMQDIDNEGAPLSSASLSPSEFRPFKLAQVLPVNHDTNIYRFNLEKSNTPLNLPVASFILLRTNVNGKDVVRPYTPISTNRTHGHFDLMIKSYPEGKISKHVSTMKPHEFIEVKGPIVKFEYKPNKYKEIGMIAGGTGITPMLQILDHALTNCANDHTKFVLIFANKSKEDILLKDRLDRMSILFRERFTLHYVVDKAEGEWEGDVGHVTKELIEKYLPGPDPKSQILVCGPPPMMKAISGEKAKDFSQGELSGVLQSIGYSAENVFKF
ncbi:NADH-cytochrome b5 reductase [Plasmodiophora brassicae]|uniref:NADH-cytochrome b5 reductase n=1 Tax=Plasmodiophora brassicae TaxID=37360 RepID=A0A3P3XYH3_PLABS|nr:unnamed protein product [Plasmodiophora brassicae]